MSSVALVLTLSLITGQPATAAPPSPDTIPPGARVAVMNFVANAGATAGEVEELQELVATEMKALNAYAVLSGGDVKAVLDLEASKQAVGCGTDDCLAELADALGVEFLVTGSLGKIGESWVFQVRLLNVKTATAVKGVARETSNDAALVHLPRSMVAELVGRTATAGGLVTVEVDPLGFFDVAPWVTVGVATLGGVGAGVFGGLALVDAAAMDQEVRGNQDWVALRDAAATKGGVADVLAVSAVVAALAAGGLVVAGMVIDPAPAASGASGAAR